MRMKAKKKRLDEILIERGIAENKIKAEKMIIAGEITASGHQAIAPSQMFAEDSEVMLKACARFVGRGGEKLSYAVKTFRNDIRRKICVDIGTATGGFVDVLLQNGAKKVYAIDTAKGKLDLKLREDSRVIVMEGTNILYLKKLPELADIISIDVSLTSLRLVFPILQQFLKEGGEVIALFKPQYEIRNARVLHHGVVKDSGVGERALADFIEWLGTHNWKILGQTTSPIRGMKGNIEFLLHAKYKNIN